jgi:ribosomal protein L37AE/L43A
MRKIFIMTYSSYELKYCERCGGLGLRRTQSDLPYCCDCEQMMQGYLLRPPSADAKPGQLRRIVHHRKQPLAVPSAAVLAVQEAVHAG